MLQVQDFFFLCVVYRWKWWLGVWVVHNI